jgi:hypothetical protein
MEALMLTFLLGALGGAVAAVVLQRVVPWALSKLPGGK